MEALQKDEGVGKKTGEKRSIKPAVGDHPRLLLELDLDFLGLLGLFLLVFLDGPAFFFELFLLISKANKLGKPAMFMLSPRYVAR